MPRDGKADHGQGPGGGGQAAAAGATEMAAGQDRAAQQ